MITFEKTAQDQMIAIGEKGYPHEICGLMFGKAGDTRTVVPRYSSAATSTSSSPKPAMTWTRKIISRGKPWPGKRGWM
jgi:proteasome lid subunit RPN8/RPN11